MNHGFGQPSAFVNFQEQATFKVCLTLNIWIKQTFVADLVLSIGFDCSRPFVVVGNPICVNMQCNLIEKHINTHW